MNALPAVDQGCTYFLTIQLQSYGASPIHTSILFIPLDISALIFRWVDWFLSDHRTVPANDGRTCYRFDKKTKIPRKVAALASYCMIMTLSLMALIFFHGLLRVEVMSL
jgi:hypothetical protein